MPATPQGPVVVDASALAADLSTVDVLARLQLGAHRGGEEIRLRAPSGALVRLIAFVGLDDVLRVEPWGQTEQREEPLGVEEERQLLDPPT